jgi:hypothetical protein
VTDSFGNEGANKYFDDQCIQLLAQQIKIQKKGGRALRKNAGNGIDSCRIKVSGTRQCYITTAYTLQWRTGMLLVLYSSVSRVKPLVGTP